MSRDKIANLIKFDWRKTWEIYQSSTQRTRDKDQTFHSILQYRIGSGQLTDRSTTRSSDNSSHHAPSAPSAPNIRAHIQQIQSKVYYYLERIHELNGSLSMYKCMLLEEILGSNQNLINIFDRQITHCRHNLQQDQAVGSNTQNRQDPATPTKWLTSWGRKQPIRDRMNTASPINTICDCEHPLSPHRLQIERMVPRKGPN
jgi:hypothetical protein